MVMNKIDSDRLNILIQRLESLENIVNRLVNLVETMIEDGTETREYEV